MPSKVLIMSHPRCGSSNLTRFIRAACPAKTLMEPFNFRMLGESLPGWRDVDDEALTRHFQSVFSEASVVKHIYGQHTPSVDGIVASLPEVEKIVFLHRCNAHAAALSSLIAKKVGGFNTTATGELGRMEPDELERIAKNFTTRRDRALAQCAATGKPVLAVSYESAFPSDETARRAVLRGVLSFLGAAPSKERFETAFTRFMAPDKKLNSCQTYGLIENVRELHERFPQLS